MGKDVRTFAVATSLATLAALAGCDDVAHTQLSFSATEKATITEIRVSGGSGDITIRGNGPAGEVRIDRVVRYRGDEPGRTYRVSGTVLHIDTDCGASCRVTYDIQAPPGVAVRGQNGSGDVVLSQMAAVDVRLGSGSIDVSDSTADVVAHTGSGDVTVALLKPADVRAGAGSGDITITVPQGRYRVNARTGSGDSTINVPDNPAGEHLVEIDSGSGDITLVNG